ncbi:MAG: hypothetical protein ACXITV_00895 [Luteibaculaceae bacterium]
MIICIFVPILSYAQVPDFKNEKEFKKYADKLFEEEKFVEAEPLFGQLLSNSPRDSELNYKYGTCIIFGNQDKELAVRYLNFASRSAEIDPKVFFYLGRANHLVYNFNAGLNAYKKFLDIGKPADIKRFQVERQIEMCKNGRSLLRDLKEVAVLDKKEASNANFFRFYDLEGIGGKILVAPDELISKIDKKLNHIPLVHVPNKSNVLYFSSYGETGNTGLDIYKAKRNPSGGWFAPEKVFGDVNTPFDEDFPYMHPDGKTLYFSSKGHNSMGGYDIFTAIYNVESDRFENIQNLDFAINSAGDDLFYLVDSSKTLASFASTRGSKLGGMSVYRVATKSRIVNLAFIEGVFVSEINPGDRARIVVQKFPTNETVGVFESLIPDGNYTLQLPGGGTYNLLVKAESGKLTHQGVIEVPKKQGINVYRQELSLVEVNEKEKLVINNFFDNVVKDADIVALARSVILEKAELNVNADQFDLDSDDESDLDIDKLASEAGIKGNLTNNDIIQMAFDDVEKIKKEVESALKIAETALSIANDKAIESKLLKSKLNEINEAIDLEGDPLMRTSLLKDYAKTEAEFKVVSNQALTAYNLSNQINQIVDEKQLQVKEASEFAEAIKEAIEAKNFQVALAKLRNQMVSLEEYGKSSKNDAYKITLAKAQKKQEEADKELEIVRAAVKEEQEINAELKQLNNNFFIAKKKDERDFIQIQIDQNNQFLANTLEKIETAKENNERLKLEAKNLELQAEMLLAIMQGSLNSASVVDRGSLSETIKNIETQVASVETVYDIKLTPPSMLPILSLGGITFTADKDYLFLQDKFKVAKPEEMPHLNRLLYEVNLNWLKEIDFAINQLTQKSGTEGFTRTDTESKIKELNKLKFDRIAEIREYETLYGKPTDDLSASTVKRGNRVTVTELNADLGRELLAAEGFQGNPVEKAKKLVLIRQKVIDAAEKELVLKQGLAKTDEGALSLRDLKLMQEKLLEKDNIFLASYETQSIGVSDETPAARLLRISTRYESEVASIQDAQGQSAEEIEEQLFLAKENFNEQLANAVSYFNRIGGDVDTTGSAKLDLKYKEVNKEFKKLRFARENQSLAIKLENFTEEDLNNSSRLNQTQQTQLRRDLENIEESLLSENQRIVRAEILAALTTEPVAIAQTEIAQNVAVETPKTLAELVQGFSAVELANSSRLNQTQQTQLRLELEKMEETALSDDQRVEREAILAALTLAPVATAQTERAQNAAVETPKTLAELVQGFSAEELANSSRLNQTQQTQLRLELEKMEETALSDGQRVEREVILAALTTEPVATAQTERAQTVAVETPKTLVELVQGFSADDLANLSTLTNVQLERLEDQLANIDSPELTNEQLIERNVLIEKIQNNRNKEVELTNETKAKGAEQTEITPNEQIGNNSLAIESLGLNANNSTESSAEVARNEFQVNEEPQKEINIASVGSTVSKKESELSTDELAALENTIKANLEGAAVGLAEKIPAAQVKSVRKLSDLVNAGVNKNQILASPAAATEELSTENYNLSLYNLREFDENGLANETVFRDFEVLAGIRGFEANFLAYQESNKILESLTDKINEGTATPSEQKAYKKEQKLNLKLAEKIAPALSLGLVEERDALKKELKALPKNESDDELVRLAQVYNNEARELFKEARRLKIKANEAKNAADKIALFEEAYRKDLEGFVLAERSLIFYNESQKPKEDQIVLLNLNPKAGFEVSDNFERKLISGLGSRDKESLSTNAILAFNEKDTKGPKAEERNPVRPESISDQITFDEPKIVLLNNPEQETKDQESVALAPEVVQEKTDTANSKVNKSWAEIYQLTERQLKQLEENPEFDGYLDLQARYEKLFAEYQKRKDEEEGLRKTAAARVITLRELLIKADETDNIREKSAILDEIEKLNLETEELLARAEVAARVSENTLAEAESIQQLGETFLQQLDKTTYDRLVVFKSDIGITSASEAEVNIQASIESSSNEIVDQPAIATKPLQNESELNNELAASSTIPTSEVDATTTSKDTRSNMRIDANMPLQSDMFSMRSASRTVNNTPVEQNRNTVDNGFPRGLIFSVQVGAFRNPVSESLFSEFSPVRSERIRDNITRYTAGFFTNFGNANAAKNAIRNIGYGDAFVVAYLDGNRIPLNDAFAMARNSNQLLASNSTSLEGENTIQNTEGEAQRTPLAVAATESITASNENLAQQRTQQTPLLVSNVLESAGLFYTVQVGVFSKAVSKVQFLEAPSLNAELLPNGTTRYSSGKFTSVAEASNAKNEIVSKGISDAFVIAYFNGKRISVGEAASLEFSGVEANITPLPLTRANSESVRSNAENTNTSSQRGSDPVEVKEDVNLTNNIPSGSYRVFVGTFTGEVPSRVANAVLELIDRGIETIRKDNTITYQSRILTNENAARQLKQDFERRGVSVSILKGE